MRREFLRRLLTLLLFVYASFAVTLAQGGDAADGTAMVAYRTENEIVVAADSKVTRGTFYVEPICKIRQFGNIFVTAGGLYRWPAGNFDLWKILSKAALGGAGLSDIVKRFETFVELPLKNTVKAIKNQEPNLYQEKLLGKPSIAVLFFGIEDNVLTLKYRVFYVHPKVDDVLFSVDIKAGDCPGSLCPAGKGVVFFKRDEVDNQKIEEMFSNPFVSGDPKCDVVDLARKFVQMMIDKNAINYGPPIDILSITKDGAKWIQKKEECPEIKK